MLGQSRSGRAMPNTQLFLLSSIAAYTVRGDPTVSCLAIAAGSLADEAAIVKELDWPPFIGSFWHESSAAEPGGPARDGRAYEPGTANIPAMPVMADSSTQPSHPRRSEPISKPAGLHL